MLTDVIIDREHKFLLKANMQIPGLGRFNKSVSGFIGNTNRSTFNNYIVTKGFKADFRKIISQKRQVDLELVTFADSRNFSDLLLSILSFVHAIGLPARWTLYSGDSYTAEQSQILGELDFLECKAWDINVSGEAKKYADQWQIRKYLSFSTHLFQQTTIFLDSDVIFYNGFKRYIPYLKESNWYLAEPIDSLSIDKELLKNEDYKPDMFIINAGFMILNTMPPWSIGLGYLKKCLAHKSDSYFLDQSALNIVYVNDANAKILEPRAFHVSTIDHFRIRYLETDKLAMRHYVGPVRHKMWQAGWKQFISIS
jgi:hypothetical protein